MRADDHSSSVLSSALDLIREECGVSGSFPADVEAAAAAALVDPSVPRRDVTDLAFVTLDPASSTDLDQAFHVTVDGNDVILHYAIADIAAFVPEGGVVEAEAWRRGVTVYAPDGSTPLYPRILSADRASLLPDGPRPAVLLTVSVAPDGTSTLRMVERAMVRSRAKLAYETVTPADLPPATLELSDRVSRAEDRRGAFRVDLPVQETVSDPAAPAGIRLRFAPRLASEDQNAGLSLAANLAVATAMLQAGVGLFRVMDDPDERETAALRRSAHAAGIAWADGETLRQVIPRLDPVNPRHVAFSINARRAGGGASYYSWPSGVGVGRPEPTILAPSEPAPPATPAPGALGTPAVRETEPPKQPWHAAIAAPYAHVTAPMRRLADRYVLEFLLALYRVDGGDRAEMDRLAKIFDRLPPVMAEAERCAAKVDRSSIDLVECLTLQNRVGERFAAEVIDVNRDLAQIQFIDVAVVARVKVPDRRIAPGASVTVVLEAVDVPARRLQLRVTDPT